MRTKNLIAKDKNILGNIKRYRFSNNYGASVIDMGGLGMEYEVAVLEFYSDEHNDSNITYDTPITDDVLKLYSEKAVDLILSEIEQLGSYGEVKNTLC